MGAPWFSAGGGGGGGEYSTHPPSPPGPSGAGGVVVDSFMLCKWLFKSLVAVFLVTHAFDITVAVFDVAQPVVSGAAGVIGGETSIDAAEALASMQDGLEAMEIPELLLLVMETSLVSRCMKIMSVLITVILYGRMIEIYL